MKAKAKWVNFGDIKTKVGMIVERLIARLYIRMIALEAEPGSLSEEKMKALLK